MKRFLIFVLILIFALPVLSSCVDSKPQNGDGIIELISVPGSSSDCGLLLYEKAVEAFRNVGFTNVKAIPVETEYSETVRDGSIIILSVDDVVVFDDAAMFDPAVPVRIYYRVMLPKPEETPVIDTTPEPIETPAVTEAPTPENNSGQTVWIPQSGTKYHSNPSCSNMKNPTQVTVDQAQKRGYTPCKRCF